MWYFGVKLPLDVRLNIDERKQKTNFLMNSPGRYDSVLFGTSRMTYLDTELIDERLYNFSVSSMSPWEYSKAYEIFVKTQGVPKKIYVELSPVIRFTDSDLKMVAEQEYESSSSKVRQLFEHLINADIFVKSIFTVLAQFYPSGVYTQFGHRFYDKDFKGQSLTISDKQVEKLVRKASEDVSGKLYSPLLSKEYLAILDDIRMLGPDVIAIIPPMAEPYRDAVITHHGDYLAEWHREVVKRFDSVITFNTNSKKILDYTNWFKDSIHFYRAYGDVMAESIHTMKPYPEGCLLDIANIETYLLGWSCDRVVRN